jgi:hypothetical protein
MKAKTFSYCKDVRQKQNPTPKTTPVWLSAAADPTICHINPLSDHWAFSADHSA